jgi:hypothetical protein
MVETDHEGDPMRKDQLGRWAALPAVLALAFGVMAGAAPAGATTRHTVRIQANNFYWCPNVRSHCSSSDSGHVWRIVRGTKVVWIYKDKQCSAIAICPGHNVKIGSHRKSSTTKTQNAVIKRMIFKSVGTFHFVCTHHKNMGMIGTIKVRRPAS